VRADAGGGLRAVRVGAGHLGADLQAVAGALDLLHARQLADRRIQQVERLARLQRDLDLAALAVGQRARIDPAGDQAHPSQVRERAGDHEPDHHQAEQDHRLGAVADQRQRRPDHHRGEHEQEPGRGEPGDEQEAGNHGGGCSRWDCRRG